MRPVLIAVLSLLVIFDGFFLFSFRHKTSVSGGAGNCPTAPAPHADTQSAAEIEHLLTQQAADWNRGDLDAFATGYKNSPDILFIGKRISRGYDGMLASYRKGYASREAMGTLTFSQLEVQPLGGQTAGGGKTGGPFATTTGHYHLERTSAGGGNADGYFLLVLEDTPSGWKIVRDDTTSLPAEKGH